MSHLHLSQKEIYFDQLLDPESPVYNIGTYVVIKGELNAHILIEAIHSATERFDVFKFGSFSEKSPEPSFVDVIDPIEITELDYSAAEWTDERTEKWLKERINRPFDIYAEKLYDFLLIKRGKSESWLYIGCHHLFSDGYGVPYVLLKYIFDAYHHLKTGNEIVFSAPSYLDLIDKSNAYLSSEDYNADKEYWKQRFQEAQESIITGGDAVHSAMTDAVQLRLSEEQQESLREFCRENRLSLQDFLVALLTVYYTKVKKTQTFDFCLATHNRTSKKERQVLGAFSKLLPSRLSIDNPTLRELFDQIRSNQRSDYRHKEFPVSHFRQLLQNEKNPSSPFDICVNYRYFRLDTVESELELKGVRNDASYAQTPIEFSWCDFAENGREDLFLEITFRTDCFSKAEMTFLKDRIQFLMDQFYHSMEVHVNDLEVLPAAEKQQLIFGLNEKTVPFPEDKTVVDVFEEQVLKTPEHLASVFVDNGMSSELSYAELSSASNEFAAFLMDRYELKQGELVGVQLGRHEFLVTALLGVMKSGGVYVPIDPNFPKERIDFIQQQCKCSIGEEELKEFHERRSSYTNEKISIQTKPLDLAYVIFTSGSTGTPKGVMISHQSLVNKLTEEPTVLDIDEEITSFCLTNFTFDVSLLEIFLPLLSGGKVVNTTEEYITDISKCVQEIVRHEVNLLQGTPTFFNHFVNSIPQDKLELLNNRLKVICIGGESLSASLVSSLKRALPRVTLNNHYGPTEITIDAIVQPNVTSFESNIIGKPLGNTKVYLLDDKLSPTPFFETGEIFISGPSVGQGYLNEPALSAEAFLENPFEKGTIYRTGDLAKLLDSGEIVFLGRKDEQVKVRGYRIELEEIEHALNSKQSIIESAVIAIGESENKQLQAYITAHISESFEDVRNHLLKKLPQYMIPAVFVQLDEMPLTSSGKLDKKSLVASLGNRLIGEDGYIEPSTEIERKIVGIWEDILDQERIGIHDDFFAIGGHSLQAVRLNNAYQKEFGADLDLKDIFQHPVLLEHVELIESSKRNELFLIPAIIDDSDSYVDLTRPQQFPISDAQRRLWVLSQLKEASVAYNMAGSVDLKGNFDANVMQKAFELLIERHEVLRTLFRIDEKDEIKQWIYHPNHFNWKLQFKDVREENQPEKFADEYIASDSLVSFDLEKGPLFRACLFQLSENHFRLYFNIHHIISDGWSLEVLEKDLFTFYDGLIGDDQTKSASDILAPLRIQYKDYAVWQNAILKDGAFEESKSYWLNEFSGDIRHFDLPSYTQRPRLKTYQGKVLSTWIDDDLTQKLDAFSKSEESSVFTILMAVWSVLFYKYSLQDEITIGTSSAGRMHPDLENQLGFYVNTLAIKNAIDPDKTFTEFLRGVRTKVLDAFTNQMYPFDRLVEELNLIRETSRSPIFDILFSYQNIETKGSSQVEKTPIESYDDEGICSKGDVRSKFDVDISMQELNGELHMDVVFNPDVYEEVIIRRMMNHFKQLLSSLLSHPQEKVGVIQYLSTDEIQEQITGFNSSTLELPEHETVLDLLKDQLSKTPKAIALSVPDANSEEVLTYTELDALSNQLANYLLEKYQLESEELVGIKLNRSHWMLVSVLAVLKTGAAYVPIDPEYPAQRIKYIEEDSKCKVTIDEREIANFRENTESYSETSPIVRIEQSNLAYVIYTSGSTGNPKGVMIEHGSLYAFLKWTHSEFERTKTDTVLFTTSLNFDLSIFEMLYPLTTGKKVKLLKNGLAIAEHLNTDEDLLVNTVPSVVRSLVDLDVDFSSVKVLNMAGEPIPEKLRSNLLEKVDEVRNLYGPSEDTTYSTVFRLDQDDRNLIGRPIANTDIYLLNDHGQIQTLGTIGEIHIGGSGLFRGYINREDLTNEKMIANPFKEGEKLYKTGDLAKWTLDGQLQFIGRKDDQVKIRGYRIELQEIQQALSKHSSVDKCTVVVWENSIGSKEIVAYYEGVNEVSAEELRNFLKETLPSYMLPTYFVLLDKLPLTENGKIDKKSLPNPSESRIQSDTNYIAPKSELEKVLVDIWEEILERENIGVNDDFFALGGHSLKAVRINNQFQKRLGATLDLDALFSNTTIAEQAQLIQSKKVESFVPIPSIYEQESSEALSDDSYREGFPISDAQRRLWTLSQFEDDLVAYNMPSAIELEGEYEIEWLQMSFDRLIERHEILRTVFKEDTHGQIRQRIRSAEQIGFTLTYEDYSLTEKPEEKVREYISANTLLSFDLEKGPLFRSCLFKVEQDSYILYFNIHHIISDGWSLEVLYNDLFSIYEAYQKSNGESALESDLKELRIHYKDYSVWQLNKLNSEEFEDHRTFWESQLSGDLPIINLPTSKQRPRLKTYAGRAFKTSINADLTQLLNNFVEKRDGTVFMGLLAVWKVLMYRYTSQKDIVIGSPVAGREHPDLEDQIGFYVNTVVFRNRISPEEDFDAFFARLKDNTLGTYAHQNYPFDRLIEDLEVKRDTSRNPVFDVMLVLQNEASGQFRDMQLRQRSLDLADPEAITNLGTTAAKFDIDLTFQEVGDIIEIEFVYNTDVYEYEMMVQLIQHFKHLLKVACTQPKTEIGQLNFLTEEDKIQLIHEFNNFGNETWYPKDKTIADLFEEQVLKSPDKVAIGYSLYGQTFSGDKLTYSELNKRSNQLAHYLVEKRGVQSGDLVGVVLDRSLDYAIALLGILKASACCAPVNPDFPIERKTAILANTKTVIDATLLADLDREREAYSTSNPSRKLDSSSLAYVLFTSGSTGESKGCMLENRGIINHLYSKINLLNIDSTERILHTSKMYFVGGIWQLWAPLICGAELIIPELEAIQDIGELIEKSIHHQVKVLEVIPSQMSNLFALDDDVRLSGLQTLILTGEPLKEQLIQQVLDANPQINIVNTYGQTECSDVTTMYEISNNKEWNHRLVGRAIQNTKHYILDENGQLCPLGVTGEIHTAGVCVSRGYLNKEELTSNFFKENPFVEGERLYKTGDLAKWTESGEVEFVGRKDNQVKVRGYRVEPGEIEQAVLKLSEMEEAAVTILENPQGENDLVLYFTAGEDIEPEQIRAFLREELVEYMIPSYYVQLSEIPLTSNGKIDKKSLPIPEDFGQVNRSMYVPPKTELEGKLVDIWKKVLLREKIGCQDDFFDLGGHSLKAVRLNNAYQKELNAKLLLRDLLTSTTITAHAQLLEKAGKADVEGIPELSADQISEGHKNGYPLSDAQRRIWVLSQFRESSVAYNMTGTIKVDSKIEFENMKRSLEFLLNRHEALRTVFKENDNGEIRQWVLPEIDTNSLFSFHDFTDSRNSRQELESFIRNESETLHDLVEGPLLKVALFEMKENEFVLFFNMHHIIGDGWSLDVLSREIFACYEAFKSGDSPQLTPLRIQYKEYTLWQQGKLESSSFNEHQSFWMNELKGDLPILDLPSAKQRPKLKTSRGNGYRIALENKTVDSLKQYATKHGGSLFTGLLTVWNILLHRYSERNDIIIGTPVAGREHADLENQIGCYVNTLPLRNEVNPEESFGDFHDKVVRRFQESFEHAEYPFDRLVDDLKLKRDTSRNAIFDVMLALQEFDGHARYNEVELFKERDEEYGLEELTDCTSKFDLDISFLEVEGVFSMQLVYNSDVYEASLMRQLVIHFNELLSRVLEDSDARICELEYITNEEKQLLLDQSSEPGSYPHEENVISLFESQVDATPTQTAVVFPSDEGDKELSYAELDELSNQLASYLKSNFAIEANDLIGIKLERSEWIPVVILGILKSGGAYVPIDPSSPDQRVAFIEEDTGCKLLLDQKELESFIAMKSTFSTERHSTAIEPSDLAYIIYTSGTTGTPKGVKIDHHNVVRLFKTEPSLFAFTSNDVWTMFHSYAFDFSVWEMYGALLFGGKLVVVPQVIAQDTSAYLQLMEKQGVTILNQTPSAFYGLSKKAVENNASLQVRTVIFGGEALSPGRLSDWNEQYPDCELINMYGITEGTVHTTFKRIDKESIAQNMSNIGTAIPTVKCLVLDQHMNLVPVGVGGELYIGGEGVAQGYLNRAELTRQRFVENPYDRHERLYRTGDKVRLLPTGDLEYLGRIDNQVKIRGYRIELGEIEHALQQHTSITETVVVARPNEEGTNELVAYVVSTKEETVADLRSFLSQQLPEYMLPSYYVQLEELPLNNNGKVDKKALPNPKELGLSSGTEYVAPETEIEKALVEIWQEVLQREKVGAADDFFNLGGHSLKVVRLINLYQQQFNVKLTLKELFVHTTVSAHAKLLNDGNKQEFLQISPVQKQASYALSDAQKRLWVLSQFEETSKAYNMPAHVRLKGEYHPELFEQAIIATIERHEILRTVFKVNETDEIRQWILSVQDIDFKLRFEDFSEQVDKEQQVELFMSEDAYQPFDLEKGPLFRVALIQMDAADYICYFNMHHIISDGWSMDVLSKDVFAFYEAFEQNQTPDLPSLHIQYKDYVAWQQEQFNNPSFQSHKEFWKKDLSDESARINLPSSKKRPKLMSNKGEGLQTIISKSSTQAIKKFAANHDGTLFTTVLALWKALLYRYTSQHDITIGTPVAGRDHIDLENQIGCYVNTLVLKNEVRPDQEFEKFHDQVKGKLHQCYEHVAYPFDRLVDDLNLKRDTSRNAIFDVMLVFQDFEESSVNNEADFGHPMDEGEIYEIGNCASKFDIEITFREENDTLLHQLIFNPDVYDRSLMKRLISHFEEVLKTVLEVPKTLLGDIDVTSIEEREKLLVRFNDTHQLYVPEQTVIDLFKTQVEKSPDKVAIYCSDDSKLSFRELDELSNQFARYLQSTFSLEQDDLVGVKLERSEWVIVSILGVLKSGAAYVPIDPNFPQDRIANLQEACACNLGETELNLFKNSQEEFSTDSLEVKTLPENLVYSLYTSGSTGKPKGVQITHSNLYNYLSWSKEKYLENSNSSGYFGLYSSLSFDLTVTSIFLPLISGNTLHIYPAHWEVSDIMRDYFDPTTPMDIIKVTPAHVELLAHLDLDETNVKTAIVGGEELRASHVRILRDLNPQMKIFNEYGPTECTVGCTVSEIGQEEKITIGEPVANTQAYIVNAKNCLQPIDVAGELLIGGAQVAQGYLNNDELTSEKFTKNPFIPNSVVYRTGDLAKWNEDGSIAYLGRIDDQVKIRGYRVELGEVQYALQQHPSITDSVVLAHRNESETNELIAYIVSNQEETVADLHSFLSKALPHYMIPAYFIRLDQIPLNSNGKVDKKALPSPELGLNRGTEYRAPETDTEKKLVKIWQEVLQLDQVGITDDFFHLGGHSLKVIRLINYYQKEFGTKLTVRELFVHTTIREHSELILKGTKEEFSQITPVEQQESYPLSDAQKRLWVLSQFEEVSKAYNMPAQVHLKGEFDKELFEKAILATVDRHEILRTIFKTDEQSGEIRQWVRSGEEIDFKLRFEDFSTLSDKTKGVNSLIEKDSYVKFDLEIGPLFRVVLIKLDVEEYLCYFNTHHIISDGWSMVVLSNDVFAFYEGFKQNQIPQLPPLRIQYKDYASWQQRQLTSSAFESHRSFWLNELSGELPVLDLLGNTTRPRVFTQNGRRLKTRLSASLSSELKTFSQERGGTLFMGLLASWNVLLYRYSSQTDLIIGTPVAGRSHADLENQIGAYINSVALRNQLDPSASFDTFFQSLKENTLNSFEHQAYPFDRLVDELQLERDTSRNPVFDVMLILQNTGGENNDVSEVMSTDDILDDGFTSTKLDLGITCLEEGGGITLSLEYNTDIYARETIETLIRHYKQLLSELISSPKEQISEIDFLSENEVENLLHPFGNISGAFPQDKSVVDLFEEQVNRTPDKTAVKFLEKLSGFHGIDQSTELNYSELNKSANQIARYLHDQLEIQQNDIVAFQLPRNERLIQLIWGILKAGAAYLPLNIDTPTEKIEYVRKDSGCKLIIDEKLLDEILEGCSQLSHENLKKQTSPDHLVYLIYTSGSTGKPKGVMITHGNIVAHIHNVKNLYGVSSESRFLQFFNIAFDAAAQEIFTSLSFGATLYLKTEELEADYIFELINRFGITHADFPTAFFSALMGAFDHNKYPHQLEFCAIGGEKLEMGTLMKQEDKIRLFTKAFYNVYGPTETTLIASWFPIIVDGNMTEMGDVIPIGRPYDGRHVLIMNDSQRLQPVGAVGEICIGGDSVAKGYLNRDQLNDQKFITNPYLPELRLYRTGDLGKRLPNGHLEFVGRKDDQVKIRGYRIELGEIEHHLLKHPDVEQCVVVTKETEEYTKELVAYLTCKEKKTSAELRAHLRKKLPAYMIPFQFIQLERMPLTANGKVDKRALPEVELSIESNDDSYVKPESPEEKALIEVCENILKREKIGVKDNFYNLGGDSVKSIQVVARLKQRGYSLKVEDVLTLPVMEELALRMKESVTTANQSEVTGIVELTPIQKWFFSTDEIKKHHHVNQSVLLKSSARLDANILEQCFERLVQHHDALRMSYRLENEGWIQENKGIARKNYTLQSYDLTNSEHPEREIGEIGKAVQGSFDLKEGPLLKALYFELKGEYRLGIIAHHLVVDGVSWRIILEDLTKLYTAFENNQELQLPFKTDSFQKWARTQLEHAQGELLKKERAYWERFHSLESDHLPLKKQEGIAPPANSTISFSLNKEITALLNSSVHNAYSTEVNDVLLSTLGRALKKAFNVDRTILKMEGHGREDIFNNVDVTRTVGWFTTMYPFLLDVSQSDEPLDTLIQVKDDLRSIPAKGIGFGMLKYLSQDGLDVSIDNQVLFNFLGDINASIGEDSGLFEFADEQLGTDFAEENNSNVPLDIVGVVVNDMLNMSIRYSTDLLDENRVKSFADAYEAELKELILTLSQLTEKKTTRSDLTFSGISNQELKQLNAQNNLKDIYELSPLQEGMYYHWLSNDSSILYFEEATYEVRAKHLDIDKLQKAYQTLIDRHDVLRTHFSSDFAGTPLQIVKKKAPYNFRYIQVDENGKESTLLQLKSENRASGFDLESGSQMRLLVIDLGNGQYEFIWSYHHVIMDGWCIGVLVNEFNVIFSELLKNNVPKLPPAIPYSNYINWLKSVDEHASLKYWNDYLADYAEPAEIPFKLEEEREYVESNEHIQIEGEVFEKIDELCSSLGITMNTFIQTIWGYLLAQYNGRQDVVFGAVVSGRPGELDGVEDMIGLFNNTIPIRVKYDEDDTPIELLKKMHQQSIQSSDHHYVSLAQVQSQSELKSNLLDHIMVFENYVMKELETEGELNSQNEDGLKIDSISYFDQTNYNFNLTVYPGSAYVHINIRFNSNYYDTALIQRIKNHLEMVVERFIDNSNTPLNA